MHFLAALYGNFSENNWSFGTRELAETVPDICQTHAPAVSLEISLAN
jgi:hypothetical protein